MFKRNMKLTLTHCQNQPKLRPKLYNNDPTYSPDQESIMLLPGIIVILGNNYFISTISGPNNLGSITYTENKKSI